MHFPDSDPRWRGADSRQFLTATLAMLAQGSWRVVNVDLTLLAQQPQLAPWREQVRQSVAALLAIAPSAVNVKATSTEHLGFLGRNEGLAAMATVLIEPA
jgi:2-C-methyl-D-erythritol 2,4-cyclodiphosphate synthase